MVAEKKGKSGVDDTGISKIVVPIGFKPQANNGVPPGQDNKKQYTSVNGILGIIEFEVFSKGGFNEVDEPEQA